MKKKNFTLKTMFGKTTLAILFIALAGSIKSQCSTTFNYTVGSNGLVNFASTSTGTTSSTNYSWDFGDGNSAAGLNQSHTYSASGLYWVTLSIDDSTTSCRYSFTDSIMVSTAPCNATVSFNLGRDTTQALTWDVYPNYPSNVVSATWYWGDNTSSNGLYPSHTYTSAGTYPICVFITVACGDTATFCLTSSIYRMSGSSAMISVSVKNVAGTATAIKKTDSQAPARASVWPNPASERASLSIYSATAGRYKVEVYNVAGKLINSDMLNVEAGHTTMELNTSSLGTGLYFISLSNDTEHQTLRLIKE